MIKLGHHRFLHDGYTYRLRHFPVARRWRMLDVAFLLLGLLQRQLICYYFSRFYQHFSVLLMLLRRLKCLSQLTGHISMSL